MTDEQNETGAKEQESDSAAGSASPSGQEGQQDTENQMPVDQPDVNVQGPSNIIQTEAVGYSEILKRDAGQSQSKEETD